eukprot:1157389-Pelagomonas_calceolata.AAC.2
MSPLSLLIQAITSAHTDISVTHKAHLPFWTLMPTGAHAALPESHSSCCLHARALAEGEVGAWAGGREGRGGGSDAGCARSAGQAATTACAPTSLQDQETC